jgi:transcriptional regulator with XRE-family HTH domain
MNRIIFMATQVEIGQRIRRARERVGMSQEEFADAVNKDQRAISEYENGKRKVSASELSTFGSVLSVPISYFYEGNFQIDELDQMMLQEFHKLPSNEAREAVLQVIRIFSNTLKKHSST